MLLHINTNLFMWLNINIFAVDRSGALHGAVIYSEVQGKISVAPKCTRDFAEYKTPINFLCCFICVCSWALCAAAIYSEVP